MDAIRKTTETLTKDENKAVERGRNVADTACEKGRDLWKDLRGQGQEAMAGARRSAKEALDGTQELLQKHPGKAVGVALFVGVVIGGALMAMWNNEAK